MNKLNFKYLFPNLFLFCICMNLTACSEKNSGGDNLQSGDEIHLSAIQHRVGLYTTMQTTTSHKRIPIGINREPQQKNMLLFSIGVPDGLSSNQKKVNTHGNMTRISKRSFKAPLTED